MKNPIPAPRYYRLVGKRIVPCHTLEVWGTWMESKDRIVARTDVEGLLQVSTVFLGLDHNFYGKGPPILFETMIFGDGVDGYQTRCSTWEQAEQMHAEGLAHAKEVVARAQRATQQLTDSIKGQPGVQGPAKVDDGSQES
jgi:hypothetical protein